MESLTLLGALLTIAAVLLLSKLWSQGFSWKQFTGFLASLLLAIASLNQGLKDAYFNALENQQTYGAAGPESAADLIGLLANAYRNTDFLLALSGFIVLVALCSFIYSRVSPKRQQNVEAAAEPHRNPIISRWWANLIILVGAPAFAFVLGSFSDAFANPMHLETSVADYLQVLKLAYYEPAHLLGVDISNSRLIGFTRATPAWLLICLALALIPSLRKRTPSEQDHCSVMQRLLGTNSIRDLRHKDWLRNLPWRGRYLLAYITLACVLASIAPALNVLGIAFISFLYSALWIVPAAFLIVIVIVASKVKNKKQR